MTDNTEANPKQRRSVRTRDKTPAVSRRGRRSLPAGWLEECGALDLLAGRVLPPGTHDHPTHQRRHDDPGTARACEDVPGEVDLDIPWGCEHREWGADDHIHDIDSSVAARLLDTLPEAWLTQDASRWAPSLGTTLRVIRDHPEVRGHGRVSRGEHMDEGFTIDVLTIADPSLVAEASDVVPAPLPAWLSELSTDEYAAYLRSRQGCLDCGLDRHAWFLAAQRYGIRDARRFPAVDPYPAGTRDGVALAWW